MIIVNLLAKTKNKNSLKKLLYFLKDNINKNFNFINFYFPKKKKKKVITLLKSPHVNKTAQEQFEIRYFSIKIKILVTQTSKFLVFLKRIKNFLFPNIQIKTKFLNTLNRINLKKKNPFFFNKNFSLSFLKKKIIPIINFNNLKKVAKKSFSLKKNSYLKTNNLLKSLDIIGH